MSLRSNCYLISLLGMIIGLNHVKAILPSLQVIEFTTIHEYDCSKCSYYYCHICSFSYHHELTVFYLSIEILSTIMAHYYTNNNNYIQLLFSSSLLPSYIIVSFHYYHHEFLGVFPWYSHNISITFHDFPLSLLLLSSYYLLLFITSIMNLSLFSLSFPLFSEVSSFC